MGVLGVATLYCFCRTAKYLSSYHFYFKQILILLPSAPFNREEFQIKSESFSDSHRDKFSRLKAIFLIVGKTKQNICY